MKRIPNFSEFYPKSLVAIRESDQLLLLENGYYHEAFEKCTHWLIALEGIEINKEDYYYHWQVVVFPCEIDNGFDFNHPFYISNFFFHIDEAISFTSEVEEIANRGEMSSIIDLREIG